MRRYRVHHRSSRPTPYRRWVGTATAAILGAFTAGGAGAQLAFDGVLSGQFAGQEPGLDASGESYLIEWDQGTLVDGGSVTNLFHGFSRFDVAPDRGALFTGTGAPPIDHVLVRISSPTSSASWINGPVRSEIPGASLFLLNPDGILIGEHGDLQVDGALHLSSADYVLDDLGDRFELSAGASGGLLSGTPEQFGFLARSEGVDLSMPDIDIRGEMNSEGTPRPNVGPQPLWDGRIHVSGRVIRIGNDAGGVEIHASPNATTGPEVGSVQIAAVGAQATSLPLELSGFSSAAARLGADATITFEGDVDLETRPNQPPRNLAGRVVLRGGRLVSSSTGHTFMRGRGGASVDDSGSAPARPALDLEFSQSVQLSGDQLQTFSRANSPLEDAGAIRISAPEIELSAQTLIRARTVGQNRGGSIELIGSNIVVRDTTITGEASDDADCASGAGCGAIGDISITADQISLLGPATQVSVTTDSSADAGNVTFTATGDVVIDGQQTRPDQFPGVYARSGSAPDPLGTDPDPATGDTGNIRIDALNLHILSGAQVSAAAFSRLGGDGGQIDVNVSGLVSLIGGANGPSQISAETNSQTGGEAGTIRIGGIDGSGHSVVPERVELIDGGRLSTSTTGSGAAGSIAVRAGTIEIRGANALGNRSAVTTRSGLASEGGETADLELYAAGDLLVRDGALVSSTSNGDVAPGRVRLEAGGNLEISGGSELIAEARRATGGVPGPDPPPGAAGGDPSADLGDVSLRAGWTLSFQDARISTFTRRAASGDVHVSADRALESFSTTIETEVDRADGVGGDVIMAAPIVLLSDSSISADANGPSADAGNLLVSAPSALLIDATTELSADPGQLGVAGEIVLATPETNLFSTLVVVEDHLERPEERITDPCEASREDEGRFDIGGQTPELRSPEDLLPTGSGIGTQEAASTGCRPQ
ncbi:MAG: filamentous hemagglutinin N-terminal domain-containing protein [bacterium]|nr:filamentous hemagglutinin N-terminal domain-containing protein [bacterium]